MLRLFFKAADQPIGFDPCNAEVLRFFGANLERGDRDVGIPGSVPVQHFLVVHLVDVVAGEHEDLVRALRSECCGRSDKWRRPYPLIPLVADALLWGGRSSMNSPSSAEKMCHPSRICLFNSSDLYCVRIKILRTSEFTQLDSVKSMIR